jgi:hypothetical protein
MLTPAQCRGFHGPLAQSVEQKTFNLLVEGSNPSRPTKNQTLGSRMIAVLMRSGKVARKIRNEFTFH